MTAPTTEQPEKAVFVKGFYTPSDLRRLADKLDRPAPSAPASPRKYNDQTSREVWRDVASPETEAEPHEDTYDWEPPPPTDSGEVTVSAAPQVEQTTTMFTERDVRLLREFRRYFSDKNVTWAALDADDLAARISRSLAPSTAQVEQTPPMFTHGCCGGTMGQDGRCEACGYEIGLPPMSAQPEGGTGGFTESDLKAVVREAIGAGVSHAVNPRGTTEALVAEVVTRYLASRPATPTTDTEKVLGMNLVVDRRMPPDLVALVGENVVTSRQLTEAEKSLVADIIRDGRFSPARRSPTGGGE